MGPYFTGALCYADDLTLISPSLRSLDEMLAICSSFAAEYDVSFNSSKTTCIKYWFTN